MVIGSLSVMATKLSTLFLSSGFGSLSGKLSDNSQFPHSSRYLLNASCKMRPRNLRFFLNVFSFAF